MQSKMELLLIQLPWRSSISALIIAASKTLHLFGDAFSWSNSSIGIGEGRFECKLHRALVNNSFFLMEEDFRGSLLINGLLDHCPILISSDTPKVIKAPF